MAIYHCSVTRISRGQGRSAIGAAAYRSAEKLENEREGITHDYTRKENVIHTEILAPEKAPEWATDRGRLWNEVERAEIRKDANTARELNIALPVELNREQQIECIRDYANENFVSRDMVADIAIHDKADGNPHAHIMITTREIDENGFSKKKIAGLDKSENVEKWRESWAEVANRHLERAGHEVRIDHRSYEAQGIDLVPTIHEGAIARKIDGRENQISDRCEINREIAKENRLLVLLNRQEILLKESKVLAEREPAPAVQKQPELPQQRQKEEVRQVVEEQQPAPKQEVPVVEKAEITLDSLLEEVKEYNAILMARDMERADRITDITKEIAEISKPYRAEAIEMHINEKWGMKWKMMQEEKTSLTKEIRKYNMGEGYSFWDKHIGGKYEKD